MTVRKVYLGSIGPFMYDDTKHHALSTDGTIDVGGHTGSEVKGGFNSFSGTNSTKTFTHGLETTPTAVVATSVSAFSAFKVAAVSSSHITLEREGDTNNEAFFWIAIR